MGGLLNHFFVVLSFLLGVFLVSQLLRARKAPGSTVAWLLIMILIPYLGVPLYLILGSRKMTGKATRKKGLYFPTAPTSHVDALPVEKLLLSSGVPPRSSDNEMQVLSTGESTYLEIKKIILNAKKSICVATFILGRDPVGRELISLLEQRALDGIEVYLLLDGLGTFWASFFRFRELKKCGGQVAIFLPLIHFPFFGNSNLRNHRKLIVVDQEVAIVGGMNLAEEYIGPNPKPDRWIDLALVIRGTAVKNFEFIFRADWEFASSNRKISKVTRNHSKTGLPLISSTKNRSSESSLQVVASGPDVAGDALYDSIVSAIFEAQKRIWIATPYFIPDETLAKSLELASRRGVDVRITLPGRSNHLLADLCRGGYLRAIEQAGGHIFYYQKRMMHAKAIVVDDKYAIVGSANLDMRSLLLNYEVGVFIYTPSDIQKIATWLEILQNQSSEQKFKVNGWIELQDGFGRILGPML